MNTQYFFPLLLMMLLTAGCREPVTDHENMTTEPEMSLTQNENDNLLTKEKARQALIKMVNEELEEREISRKREEKINNDENKAFDKLDEKKAETVKKLHEIFEDEAERELALLILEEEAEKQSRYIHGYYSTLVIGFGLSKDWNRDYGIRSEEENAKREMIHKNEDFAKLFREYQVIELPYSGDYEKDYVFSTIYSRSADFRREKMGYFVENHDTLFQEYEVIRLTNTGDSQWDGKWKCNLKKGWFSKNYALGHVSYGCFCKDEKGEWVAKRVCMEGGSRSP